MDTVTLIGRGSELAALHSVLDALAEGAGSVAIVEGEAGIGKTSLVTQLYNDAESRGLAVLHGSADELERDRPFRALGEALRGVVGDRGDGAFTGHIWGIGALLGGAGGSNLAGDARGEVPDLGYLIIERALEALEELARERPVVAVFEDLQWADPQTLRAVRAICRRLAGCPVGVVVTLRPSPRSPDLDRVLEGLLAEGAAHVHLSPLDSPEVSQLAALCAGAEPAPDLLAYLDGAGGNPLFVIELMAALIEEGAIEILDGTAQARDTCLPSTLRPTILRRLSFLPEKTRRLLRVAALLGSKFSLADLAVATDLKAIDLLAHIEPAIEAQVVGENADLLTFRHDVIREAIHDDTPQAVRRELNRAIAQALAAAGRPALQVAEHYARGADVGDADAADWLRRAAREIAPTSVHLAIDLLERALALLPADHESRAAIVAELVRPLSCIGRIDDARRLACEALAGDLSPDLESDLRSGLSFALWFEGERDAALIENRRAAEAAGLGTGVHASLLAEASFAGFFSARPETATEGAEAALELGEDAGNDHAVSLALATMGLVAGADGRIEEAISLAERAVSVARLLPDQSPRAMPPDLVLGLILIDADMYDDAEEVLGEGRRVAEERGRVVFLPAYESALANLQFHRGRLDAALAEAETGLDIVAESGWGLGHAVFHGIRTLVALHRDDLVLARSALADAERLLAGERFHAMGWLLHAKWLVDVASDQRARADAVLNNAWTLVAQAPQFAGLIGYRAVAPDIVRTFRVTDPAVARHAVEVAEEGARRSSVPTAVGSARRCRGLLDDDPDILIEAVTALRKGPSRLVGAEAAEDAADSLARHGRKAEAIELLDEARAIYDGMDAVRDLARVQASLRELGVHRRRRTSPRRASTGWESLTETELAVVRLVAEGLTNPEIGTRLFISRRTVETHVSHVFRKLGVTTRVQVATQAAARLSEAE